MKKWFRTPDHDWRGWSGPLLTILAALVLSGTAWLTGYQFTTSNALFLLIIAYSAFYGGLFSSLLSAALAVGYFLLELFIPGGLLNFIER